MFLTIDGINTRYEVYGEGEPVLVLHGWGASIEAVQSIANCISALGKQAICFDFPGFGQSEEPPVPWGVPEYAAFTRKFMEAFSLYGVDVVCHSFGGRVTVLLASEDEKLFHRLLMIGAAGIRPKRTLKWYVKTYTYKLGRQLSKIDWIDDILHLKEKQKTAGSDDYRALKSDLMRAVFVKTVNLDLTDRLPRIKNSTLLIWGDKDTSSPLYMGKLMEQRIPDAGLVIFEGAGHFAYADQYPRFCVVLKAFLLSHA